MADAVACHARAAPCFSRAAASRLDCHSGAECFLALPAPPRVSDGGASVWDPSVWAHAFGPKCSASCARTPCARIWMPRIRVANSD